MAERDQAEAIALMQEVLGEEYLQLEVESVVVEENVRERSTSVSCEVLSTAAAGRSVIAGRGVGLIDALFAGVVARFAKEYPSLQTIRFDSFSIHGHLETKQGFAGTDAKAETTLQVVNSEQRSFTFSASSRSVTASAILATLAALAYFINSERAFTTLFHALKDAQQRNRADLVQRYTSAMARLVQNTSYSQVLRKLREELG
ncbi:MAG: hypothetical protein IPL40_01675 [Proteobacteria bacterium]|nr:hypothetical protein [Pseudomonadota bacterium]